jgi:hypothetical protein
MWLNKVKVPERVLARTLSKAETVALNSAQIMDNGLPLLAGGQKIKSSMVETESQEAPEEGKAPQRKFKMPLRPRNSQFRGILDIAQNLRDVGSKVPLVVLTNEDAFLDETLRAENPNLQFIWLNETDFIDRHCKIGQGHQLHFQKLAIWKLTQFDKVIWFDTDIAFTKSVDSLFTSPKFKLNNGNRIYGQIDDYQCDGRQWSPTSGGLCSGMLLVKPSTYHFEGLMMQQKRMQSCWGDQSIIGSYFSGHGKEARVFDRNVVNFARCSKKNGWMDVVHFSGSPNAKRVGDVDKRDKDGQVLNATTVALKAAQAERTKALDEHKKIEQEKRNQKRWAKEAKEKDH